MRRRAAATIGLALAICALAPATASAGLLDGFCAVAGETPAGRLVSTGCKLGGIAKKVIAVGKKLAGGHLGGALHAIAGGASQAAPVLGLAAIVTWVVGGAAFALHETAMLLGKTTNPELGAAWFSSAYLHMAAIATLLTLPFLFAAAVQALMRSDLAMLARAAFGYLPLAMLAIAIAVPLTTLLLAASDSLSNVIEQAAGGEGTSFLLGASLKLGGLTVVARSPFVAFLIGFFVAAGALFLWLELLLREVAVYVIVLTLPLVFAAFVWPARRVWAIRAAELLVALILAKLAIISVLALGAGALNHATASASIISLLAGIALVMLGTLAPWALVKLMPLGELAAAAAGPLRGQFGAAWHSGVGIASPWGDAGNEWAVDLVAGMRRQATAPAQGADAEAARLSELGDADSREHDSATDGFLGVAGGGDPDPLRGTADPPGGQVAGAPAAPEAAPSPAAPPASGATPASGAWPAPDAPSALGPPPDPSPNSPETGAEPDRIDPAERGPRPPFQGFEGAEAYWQKSKDWPTLSLGPGAGAPPGEDDDPRPPTQAPEDGRL